MGSSSSRSSLPHPAVIPPLIRAEQMETVRPVGRPGRARVWEGRRPRRSARVRQIQAAGLTACQHGQTDGSRGGSSAGNARPQQAYITLSKQGYLHPSPPPSGVTAADKNTTKTAENNKGLMLQVKDERFINKSDSPAEHQHIISIFT